MIVVTKAPMPKYEIIFAFVITWSCDRMGSCSFRNIKHHQSPEDSYDQDPCYEQFLRISDLRRPTARPNFIFCPL